MNKVKRRVDRFKEIKRDIAAMNGAKVGYLRETTGPQAYENGLTLASNALIQEKGTQHIPPRPFMNTGFNRYVSKKTAIAKAVRAVVEQKISPKAGDTRLGVLLQSEIQKAITGGGFAPNKPSTIKRKGSSRPLVDTGKLRQGVDVRPK